MTDPDPRLFKNIFKSKLRVKFNIVKERYGKFREMYKKVES
jgi:hypothetical protein